MKNDFQIVYHDHNGKSHVIRPKTKAEDTEDHMVLQLEYYVKNGYVTGGHIESYVRGIGWVIHD